MGGGWGGGCSAFMAKQCRRLSQCRENLQFKSQPLNTGDFKMFTLWLPCQMPGIMG